MLVNSVMLHIYMIMLTLDHGYTQSCSRTITIITVSTRICVILIGVNTCILNYRWRCEVKCNLKNQYLRKAKIYRASYAKLYIQHINILVIQTPL